MNIKKITLDTERKSFESIVAMQGDNKSRYIDATIVNKSIPIDLTECTVKFCAIKPDLTDIFNDTIITYAKGGKVQIELTNQTLAKEGVVQATLVILKDTIQLSVIPFFITVLKNPYNPNAIESKSEYEALNSALIVADGYSKELQDASVNLEEKYTTRLNNFGSQLDHKANKDFYEVVFSNITPLTIDTTKLQNAIDDGAIYIKLPSNCKAKMNDKILLKNHCKIYGENTTLYKDNANEPFFTNIIPEGHTRLECVEIKKISFEKKCGLAYHIELIDPYKCKIQKCFFNGLPQIKENGEEFYNFTDKSGVKVVKVNSDTCFVNYIEENYFSKASIFCRTTDSYIRKNVIWAYTQEEGIRLLDCANLDISNNQIIGSSINGAIYGDITGTANGVCRIVNNFFDGSYEDINSGNGVNGYFTLTTISNNTFYNQSANSIRLINPNRNDISNNIFTENNKHGLGKADILFEYTSSTNMMNNVTGNTFNYTRDNSNYNCIEEFRNGVTPTVYNQYINNIVPIGVTYSNFNNGQTSGTIDNNKFKSQFVSNKSNMDKTYGTLTTTYPNTTINYQISGGCCAIYINVASSNITIPAGGSITLCKVIGELYPRYEVNEYPMEHAKDSKLRITLTSDGDLKINNWNATSEGEQIVNNLKVTLTYALK